MTRLFAAIGFMVTLSILLGLGVGLYKQYRAPSEPDAVILALDFTQDIVEQTTPSALDLALEDKSLSLLDIIRAIDKAKDDPHVKGLVARFGSTQPSLSQAQEIRAAIARFHTSGKPTYAYGASYGDFGLGNRAYYLASAFDNIWLQPVGSVGLTGLALQSPFAKEALGKIGVEADFMRRAEYKSFPEMTTRDDFSPPVRTNMQSLIDDLAAQEAAGIAESRKWDINHARQLMDGGPYIDQEALKVGLVTHIGYEDEFFNEIEKKAGKNAKRIDVAHYLAFRTQPGAPEAKATVALIYGTGLIVDKPAGRNEIAGEHIMDADTIANAFNVAAKAKDVKAILFRVDSPGGSPGASETIRRALVHAQQKGKPVFVSMGGTAASGGYWIAMSADQIVAEPGTVTGSIGVLAGKFVVGGLMQKLGIHWDMVKTSSDAGMWSMMDHFSPVQRARVNALLDATYAAFVKDVSDARKIPMEKMPDVAKGRVWTGAQAVKIGLVDQLGGYDVALAGVRKKLGLDEKDPITLQPFPPPETPVQKLRKLLKNFGTANAMLQSVFVGWHSLAAALGPVWDGVAGPGLISARMPMPQDGIGLRF